MHYALTDSFFITENNDRGYTVQFNSSYGFPQKNFMLSDNQHTLSLEVSYSTYNKD